MTQPAVSKLYQAVIDEVIESMRDAVLDEGLDEQVLAELKQLWEQKLKATKALDVPQPMLTHMAIPQARKPVSAAGTTIVTSATTLSNVQSTIQQIVPAGSNTVYRPQIQPLDMSGAAAAATMALPALYQQQLLTGQIQIQQTTSGAPAIVIPAISSGGITLQSNQMVGMLQQQAVQLQPQNLSTKPQSSVQGQVDGATDDVSSDEEAVKAPLSASAQTAQPCCRPKTRRSHKSRQIEVVIQLDGNDGSTSEEEDDIDDDDDEDNDNDIDDGENDEEPLNSEDDVSDDELDDKFETDNVVVCQYDKITRSKNRWRFNLKDGIMNINQRDHVFQKAHGEAEW